MLTHIAPHDHLVAYILDRDTLERGLDAGNITKPSAFGSPYHSRHRNIVAGTSFYSSYESVRCMKQDIDQPEGVFDSAGPSLMGDHSH